MDEEDEDIPPILQPCSICNRTFLPDALIRHERICKKTSQKKRKVFNSSKQRAEDAEISPVSTAASKTKEKPVKKSNWREKHNEFIRNIRAAKGEKEETTEESTPPKKNIPSDYIQCPSCERYFNQKAAERHITWCQSQKAHIPKHSTPNEAKERLQARTKYKAPTPGKKGKEEAQNRESAKSLEQARIKTAKPREKYSSETNNIIKKSGKTDSNINPVKSGKPNTGKATYDRDVIRSRESIVSQGSGSQQVVKFKEKFPNRGNKRSPDLEDSFSSFSNASSHFRDVLQTKASDNRSPRTVPGVRTGGLDTNMNWGQSMNGDITNEDEYSLLQKIVDLNSSFQANTSLYGDMNSSWNKKMFPSNHNLPEVSSCDEPTQAWPSRSCWGSSGNTPMSSGGSSISSLSTGTPGSRGGSSESVMPLFCNHCGSKYPISAAKYCCECGAKRRGFGTMNFKTELVSC